MPVMVNFTLHMWSAFRRIRTWLGGRRPSLGRVRLPRTPWHFIDGLLALGTWAVYLALAVLQDRLSSQGFSVLALTFFTVSSAALLWRRTHPVAVVTVTVACDCIIVVMTGWKGYGLQAMFALYAAGRHGRVWHAWLAAVVVGLFYPATALAVYSVTGMVSRDSGSLGWFVPLLLVGAGRLMHLRAETTRRRQDEIAEEVVRTERRHIARELHDVVAHNITTMQVLIGAARITMTRNLSDAEAALLSAEKAGREAMAEMRQLLHVLRADELNETADQMRDGPAGKTSASGQEPGSLVHMQPHNPAYRANAVPALVSRAREAGQPVSLEVSGRSRRLPAAIDHAIHRIVQESLTNARKHAGDVPVRVSIDYGPTMVEVKVVNEEADAAHDARRHRTPLGNGFGLSGMAERVALCGGRLETGPLPGGGFSVHAHFPLPVTDAPQPWPAARKPGERKSAEEGGRHDQGGTR
ncbi:sensor histidine kinase [Microbispora sp. KK1-11]|uniref:sensor histidine kinase n=1 Tax=Microbispora sp. KK1-11 TaxID=2053005 RepID=UPI00115A5D4D|nr:histidine kinase [Microbispora sp. KK1-11]TQS20984.1 hypothetical protein FLW16_40070 [Microbispora sp. KK1-11]